MSVVQLQITQPKHGTVIKGKQPVSFVGELTELPNELNEMDLYYRWYSSLFPALENRYSMNAAPLPDPAQPFASTLQMGAHVISFAASDQPGEDRAAQDAARHGGITGGPDERANPCVIHVFFANIITPAEATPLPRDSQEMAVLTLEAEAPLKWGKPDGAMDEDYHKINRIQYRIHFEPVVGSTPVKLPDFVIAAKDFVFVSPASESDLPIVRYSGKLTKNALPPGKYKLILRVEDKSNSSIGHEDAVNVVVE